MTTKQPFTVVAAAIAGGALLLGLAACGQGSGSATSTSTSSTSTVVTSSAVKATTQRTTPTSKPVQSTNPKGNPVNCGPVGGGGKWTVIADDDPDGTVGCTEAFNVLDEYQKAPVNQEDGTQRRKQLSHGWFCATDGGSGASAQGNVYCSDGKDDGHGGTVGGRSFHTEVTQGR